jgi:hypothetical protein
MGVKPPGPPFFFIFGRSFPDDGSLPLVPAAYFAEEGSCGGRGDPRRVGSDEGNRWWVVSRERFGVGRSIHVGRRLFCSSRETENERRETLCFSSRRALSRFVRGARVHRESRRIASRDFSRKPFAAARRAARGPRATERRGTSEGAGATSASSRLGVPRERGRDASRAGGWMRGRARGPSRVLGWSGSITGTTRDGPTRREARDARVGFRAGGASRNTRTELGTSPLAAAARLKHSPMTPRASRVTCRPREGVT